MSRGGVFYWIFLIIPVILCVGWIINIFKLVNTSFDPLTGMAIARVIGSFIAPLGGVLGYF